MSYKNKENAKAYQRKYYKENREKSLCKASAANIKRRKYPLLRFRLNPPFLILRTMKIVYATKKIG